MNTSDIISKEITGYLKDKKKEIINAFVKVYGESNRSLIEARLKNIETIYTYDFPKLKRIEIEYLTDEKMEIIKNTLKILDLDTPIEVDGIKIKVKVRKLEELVLKLLFSFSVLPRNDKDVITARMIKGIIRKANLSVNEKQIEEAVEYFNYKHSLFFELKGEEYKNLIELLNESRKMEMLFPNKLIGILGCESGLNLMSETRYSMILDNIVNVGASRRDKKEGKITYNAAVPYSGEEENLAFFNPFDEDAELDYIHEINHIITTSHLANTGNESIKKIGFEIDKNERKDSFEKQEEFVSELFNELISREVLSNLKGFKIPTVRYTNINYPNDKQLEILNEFYNRYKKVILEAYISDNKRILVQAIGEDNYKEMIETICKSYRKPESEVLFLQRLLMNRIDVDRRIELEEVENYIEEIHTLKRK